MNIVKIIADELGVKEWQVEKTIELIDDGNTIPFISRYRKEVTGSLNDEQLRDLDERLTYLRNLEEKKQQRDEDEKRFAAHRLYDAVAFPFGPLRHSRMGLHES